MPVFTAIVFETASRFRDSACAVGVVRVEQGTVVERYHRLVRPFSPRFEYTPLHGIGWSTVRDAPTFARVWPELRALFRGVDFVVTHDASFEMGVLAACCARAGVRPPSMRVKCTLQEARTWGVRPATLPAVARHLGIRERPRLRRTGGALEDAETCAEVALAAGLAA